MSGTRKEVESKIAVLEAQRAETKKLLEKGGDAADTIRVRGKLAKLDAEIILLRTELIKIEE